LLFLMLPFKVGEPLVKLLGGHFQNFIMELMECLSYLEFSYLFVC